MTYSAGFYAAWIVAVVGVLAGILASASQTPWHPAWLTNDIAATAGLISAACVGLAALLPQVTRSPAAREAKYLAALAGALPDDIAQKHGLTVTRQGDVLTVSAPEKPPDTQAGVPPAG